MIREINQYPSTKIKILIVDDHPAIRSTMSDVLINEGFEVDLAQNGVDALAIYSIKDFDFVLMDMQMPDCKGVDAYGKMLQLDKKHAEFIFISAFSAPELERKAKELGCIAFLQKPISIENIIKLIQTKSLISILVFVNNPILQGRVTNQLKENKYNFDTTKNLDETLIRIRQIDYNCIVIDEDSLSLEQERIANTIATNDSNTQIITINEDEVSISIFNKIRAACSN